MDTRGPGPSRSRAVLTCEIRRSSEPGLPACQGNIILGDDAYTPHEEAISPRREARVGREGGNGGTAGRRLGCAARMRQKVENIRTKSESKGEYRRRRFNQRGLSTSIFPLARFLANAGVVRKLVVILPKILRVQSVSLCGRTLRNNTLW